jgi:hypothetical protein
MNKNSASTSFFQIQSIATLLQKAVTSLDKNS